MPTIWRGELTPARDKATLFGVSLNIWAALAGGFALVDGSILTGALLLYIATRDIYE